MTNSTEVHFLQKMVHVFLQSWAANPVATSIYLFRARALVLFDAMILQTVAPSWWKKKMDRIRIGQTETRVCGMPIPNQEESIDCS